MKNIDGFLSADVRLGQQTVEPLPLYLVTPPGRRLRCSSAASLRFLSPICHASEQAAALQRAKFPTHQGATDLLARQPGWSDSLLLSASGPGVTINPGTRSLTHPQH